MNNVREGWEQWFLLTSDWHKDSIYFQHDLFHRHMALAKERDAGIFCFGDDHDLMQSRDDPRRSMRELKSEFAVEDYLDEVCRVSSEELAPYAPNVLMMSDGNHNSQPRKRLGVNISRRVAESLGATWLGWAGWIEFKFARNNGKSNRSTQNWWFEHGSGGGGRSSRGMQYVSHRASYLPDANGILSGHIHWTWIFPHRRVRKYGSGKTGKDIQWHASLPTYKDEFNLEGGWHVERGGEPRPIGGIWLRFYHDRNSHGCVGTELVHAIQ